MNKDIFVVNEISRIFRKTLFFFFTFDCLNKIYLIDCTAETFEVILCETGGENF